MTSDLETVLIALSSQRKELTIGTFNVRGLAKEEKQELLAQDIHNYKIDVCCLQETKVKDGRDITIGEEQHKLIALPSDNRHYGNGFAVSNNWKNNVHRHWKVSDRISVLQLNTNSKQYECINTSGINLNIQPTKNYTCKCVKSSETKLKITTIKIKHCITVINVYTPHTERVKEDPNELDQMYAEIGETITKINSDRTTKTSLLIIAGDFNAKVGKTKGEQCLGSYSRGTRNTSGQTLVDFCNVHNLFITNRSFKHPARHIPTWENTRINKNNGSITKVYNQIGYIICQTNKKHILQNARSYAGTQVNSDHRLVITKLKTANYNLFKPKRTTKHKPINTSRFSEPGVKEQYKTLVKDNCTQ